MSEFHTTYQRMITLGVHIRSAYEGEDFGTWSIGPGPRSAVGSSEYARKIHRPSPGSEVRREGFTLAESSHVLGSAVAHCLEIYSGGRSHSG